MDAFIYSDQPTTCPYCGIRTENLGQSNEFPECQVEKCEEHGTMLFCSEEDEP